MDSDIKTKWITALRNGDYTQGTKALKTDDSFCCLGVLCDIYKKETNLGTWDTNTRSMSDTFLCKDKDGNVEEEAHGILPMQVRLWARLNDCNPKIGNNDRLLAELNDEGNSFDQIADLIENNL
jgi:hypothetical protein